MQPDWERFRVLGLKSFAERTPAETAEYQKILAQIERSLSSQLRQTESAA